MTNKWYFEAEEDSELAPDFTERQELVCEFAFEAAEEKSENSAGVILMRCVPYNMEGAHWRGTVQFQKGCFSESLKSLDNGDDVAFIQANGHFSDTLEVVASSRSTSDRGTIKFDDKEDGLYAEVSLVNTNAGRDIYELVAAEVIDKCSVGVYIDRYEAETNDDNGEDITITAATLDETSFVLRPRFDKAEVKVKSSAGRAEGSTVKMSLDTSALETTLTKLASLLEAKNSEATSEPKQEAAPKRGLALVASMPRRQP